MHKIYILLLLKTLVSAAVVDNPHDIDIRGKDLNSDGCKTCHLSFLREYSGYFALNYKFLIENIVTAGSDLEVDENYTPIKSSGLCLSCHDGVNAKNVLHKSSVTINRENGHPIYAEYIEGKSSLRSKNTQLHEWNDATKISDLLANGKVVCISCHSVHNKTNKNYLRHSNTNSALCFTCHDR
ncbi:cytochrome c3 family protein [Sulfurimonas sp.]|uniref:cytochrome c3 family protein n=1 Tax=Sulfurimonas sp. TaxID=2022749 RepID=UPI002638632B|nr:cytochrome c3 family protein [Sulfurimonas sp.]MCW8894451.1 cytochrome c3 family protein [Sulfurimonas sp.]MCW9068149.1 cytochrome c3 family protein [Sulfurimonas sp.]